MQRQIETCNFLAVYFAVSSQNGESPLRDVYQRPEQSRATVPGKNKIAWPKSMPGRLSALMYSAVPKCRQGRSPKKVSTVAGNGKGATRFGPKGPATTGAVRDRARRGTL